MRPIVSYDDEVTEEMVRRIDDALRQEWWGSWIVIKDIELTCAKGEEA